MIIKGKSRAAPKELARHLARTDTNERVEVLQLDSAGSMEQAFRDWQTYTFVTKGDLGLYHANIDPDARYQMTPQQWARAVEILEEELGLQGQPRAVVLHEKNGREHIHVVWCRTDMDTMTMRRDGRNYLAHERASLRMEREFGHEHVPGKHAKRDRAKQPEFPRASVSHAEQQQAERSGLSVAERRAQMAAFKDASDSGVAFKAAVEQAGYVLAQGDKRDFILVAPDGSTISLSRELKMKAAEARAFMADVDRDALPTASEAKKRQAARATMMESSPVEDLAARDERRETQDETPAAPKLIPAVEAALAMREQAEAEKLAAWHHAELGQLDHVLTLENDEKLAWLRREQQAERDRFHRERKLTGIEGYIDAVQKRLNPGRGAQQRQERDKAWKQMYARQARELADLKTQLEQNKAEQMDALKERHAQQQRDQQAGFERERIRYAADAARAARLFVQIEADRREAEQKRQEGRALDPPPKQAK